MASRPIITPYSVITNGDMSADITSDVTIIQNTSMLSYSFSWTGSSPVGTITVEVSNDYTQNGAGTVLNAGTWNSIDLSNTASVSGNSGVGFIEIHDLASYAVRVKYNRVSGTGTLQATVVGKVK